MARLSVNVNKVATLRNSRGGRIPSVVEATQAILDAGCTGITVHPRADERHIRASDVLELHKMLEPLRDTVEFNIEGDPREDLMRLVRRVRPHQCTLVPVRPGEITSEAGWDPSAPTETLRATIESLKEKGIRVSVFVEADAQAIRWAKSVGADRIELYTEPYARACERGEEAAGDSFTRYSEMAELAHGLGLGINAGHDLDLENLPRFKALPHLDEVSIGHALMARALFVGLPTVVREYLDVLG